MTEHQTTIWNFLMEKIGNEYGVAGLMGNLYHESGLNPKNLQGTYERSLNMTDTTYTDGVDNGTYNNFVYDSAGYGLAQWTYWSRKKALMDYRNEVGSSIGDIVMQLEFLYHELVTSYPSVLNVLENATSIREASNKVLFGFERPANQGVAVQNKRAEYGVNIYNEMTGSTINPTPDPEPLNNKKKGLSLLMMLLAVRRFNNVV